MALTQIKSAGIAADAIDGTKIADAAVANEHIAADAVNPTQMAHGTDGNLITYDTNGAPGFVLTGTAGQFLKSQGSGNVPVFADVTQADTTYSISCVDGDNTDEEKIRLTAGGSGSGTDDIVLEAGSGLTIARSSDKITFTNSFDLTSVASNILPDGDNTRDLGSSSKRWANVYVGDMQLSNEGATNDVDGTWGSYTLQEGADDLFLINNRTGKKYKFKIAEVS
jgi:hypothetical protein